MKRSLLFPLLALCAAITSCDKLTEPTPDNCSLENFAKLQTGNWWVYERYETDLNNQKIAGTEGIDSTVVEGTALKFGKTAYMMVHYITNDGGITYTTDTTWMAADGERVLMLPSDINEMFCGCLDDHWINGADCSADGWTALDTMIYESMPARITKTDGTDSMITSTIQHHSRITGHRGEQGGMIVAGQQVAVREYSMDNLFELRLTEPEDVRFTSGSRTATQTSITSLTLAENIGLVQLRKTAYNVQEDPNGEAHNGVFKRLRRYSVQ